MAHWPNLTDALDRIKSDDDDAPAEPTDPRARQRVEAELVAQARQITPKTLPEPKGVLPTDEDRAAALEALAALFVVAREGFDPAAAAVPYLGKAHRAVEAPNPVRQATPDAWSTGRFALGAAPVTVAARQVARASLLILNLSTVDVAVGPSPEGPTFTVAAGATFALDCTGPVYASSADGSAAVVQVVQTFYGETV